MIPFSSEKGRTMNMILTLLSLTEVFSQDHSGQLKGRIADASSKARVGEYIGLPCQTFSEVKQLSKEFSVYWSYCNAMKCYGENIKWSWIIGMTCKGITRVNDKGPYASRTILFSNGTLEILNVKPSDETVYSCTVYSENYRSSRSSFYSLKTVSGGVPEPVVIVNAEVDDKKVTLSWKEPEQNGADITQYTIYKRISSDKKWINVGEIKDISNRVFVVQVENTKKHEFVVTATNKYGESLVSKENIKIEEMPYSAATPSSLESQKGFYPVLQIFYILFVFLVIIIIVLSVVVWKIRRRQCPRCGEVRPVDPVSLQVEDNIGPPSDLNTMESATDSDLNTMESATKATPAAGRGYYMPLHPSGRSWEVSREDVYVIKIIGKGAFSQVAQATVKNVQEHQEETTVAVKMLKGNAPASDRKDLLSELELMKKLKPHPHVIKLIGCVTESEPLMVLIEYVPCGDLLGYLRKSRGLNDTYYKNPDVQPETNLTSEQLIKFAWQVADGMCYLSSKKIVHRDLAARNVLVGEGERCKVTDFGMARNVGQENIYTRKSPGRLPVKWTAYEALLYGRYTTQSDVWSYGILLYEILTVGGSPYPDTNAVLIAERIQEGYRMPKPRHVDSKLYEIMMKCWEEDPSDRPTFEKLRRTIKDMERNHKTYVNLSQYDTRMYASGTDLTAE